MADEHLEVSREIGAIAFRTSPGALGTVATWGDWMGLVVAALTTVFLLLQIAHFIWKWRRERAAKT
jgi:hypothetical protein